MTPSQQPINKININLKFPQWIDDQLKTHVKHAEVNMKSVPFFEDKTYHHGHDTRVFIDAKTTVPKEWKESVTPNTPHGMKAYIIPKRAYLDMLLNLVDQCGVHFGHGSHVEIGSNLKVCEEIKSRADLMLQNLQKDIQTDVQKETVAPIDPIIFNAPKPKPAFYMPVYPITQPGVIPSGQKLFDY